MKVHRQLDKLPKFQRAVVTIGSYDGLHFGHRKIIERLQHAAQSIGGESIVITFHPHPRLVLQGGGVPLLLLDSIEEKIQHFEEIGIDHLVIVPFDKDFAAQSPVSYVENFLYKNFQPYKIIIGYDHKFGKNRKGDIQLLKTYQEKLGFEIEEISPQDVDDIIVSSTKIRIALQAGDVEKAAQMLHRNFSMQGTVVEGQAIGREIGFPTANIQPSEPYKLIPKEGIYAATVMHGGQVYDSMLYIGNRPTLEDKNEQRIEVNIFDFNKTIYDEKIRINFVARIRDDEKFDSLDSLKEQLYIDKANALLALDLYRKKTPTIKEAPSVAVVILNYNTASLLEKFLPQVLATDYQNLSIYVADNGSSDTSTSIVESKFPSVKLIPLPRNYGFAKGYNEALKHIVADYLILLNSDVEVTPNWVSPLIEIMERDKLIGACQPKILSYQKPSHFEYAGAAGGWIDTLGYPFCRGRIFDTLEKDIGQYNETQEIFWASGAAMCVRTSLFKGLGGFDEDYFAHMEEIDFCWRLKRAGYKIVVRPKSVVYHIGGATLDESSPQKTYLNFRNSLYTLQKNEDNRMLLKIYLRLCLDGLAALRFLLQAKPKHIRAIMLAHWHFFANFRKVAKKRNHYDEYIARYSTSSKVELVGKYPKSILWAYFVRRKRTFGDLF